MSPKIKRWTWFGRSSRSALNEKFRIEEELNPKIIRSSLTRSSGQKKQSIGANLSLPDVE